MSYVDMTKYARDDTLVAMHANVRHFTHKPTTFTETQPKGNVIFNHIQPRNKNYTMDNFYIGCKFTARLTIKDAKDAVVENALNDMQFKVKNINHALWDTRLEINGSISNTQQPYINAIINENYNPNEYIENANTRLDKYVHYDINIVPKGASGDALKIAVAYDISYKCICPIFHTYLSHNTLCGIDNFNIDSQFNFHNLFALQAGAYHTLELSDVKDVAWEIGYDEVIHTVPLESYNIQVPHYVYYQGTSTDWENNRVNVRDTKTQPLNCYLISAPNIKSKGKELPFAIYQTFGKVEWNINNETNVFGTSDLLRIYQHSKTAGLLTEFPIWAGDNQMSVKNVFDVSGVPGAANCAVSMLSTYDAKISTADLFRLDVAFTTNVEDDIKTNNDIKREYFVIFEYPSILSVSTISNSVIYSLNGTFDELTEAESGVDDYFDALSKAGDYSGNGKVGDWFRNTARKIKEKRYISRILNGISGSKKLNGLISMIPGASAAMPLIEKVQDIAGNVGEKAEAAGYGVSMF